MLLLHIASWQRMLPGRKGQIFFSWISVQDWIKDGLKAFMCFASLGSSSLETTINEYTFGNPCSDMQLLQLTEIWLPASKVHPSCSLLLCHWGKEWWDGSSCERKYSPMEGGAYGLQVCDVYTYCFSGLQQNKGRNVIDCLHISEVHPSLQRLFSLVLTQFFFFILWTLCSNFSCI